MAGLGQNATYRIVRDEFANPPITDVIVHAANVVMGHKATFPNGAQYGGGF